MSYWEATSSAFFSLVICVLSFQRNNQLLLHCGQEWKPRWAHQGAQQGTLQRRSSSEQGILCLYSECRYRCCLTLVCFAEETSSWQLFTFLLFSFSVLLPWLSLLLWSHSSCSWSSCGKIESCMGTALTTLTELSHGCLCKCLFLSLLTNKLT